MASTKNYAAIFGSNFHAARLRAGLKITDVSERTGIDLGRISLIEHGGLEVTIQSMGLLAEAIGCPFAYSDDVAQSFRLDVAHRSDLMSPSVPG